MSEATITVLTPDVGQGVLTMADGVASMDLNVLSHVTTRLVQTGTAAHEAFTENQNLITKNYMMERNMVSLPFALGAREVGSKEVPAGPTSKPAA
jgi:hypothetical protein